MTWKSLNTLMWLWCSKEITLWWLQMVIHSPQMCTDTGEWLGTHQSDHLFPTKNYRHWWWPHFTWVHQEEEDILFATGLLSVSIKLLFVQQYHGLTKSTIYSSPPSSIQAPSWYDLRRYVQMSLILATEKAKAVIKRISSTTFKQTAPFFDHDWLCTTQIN